MNSLLWRSGKLSPGTGNTNDDNREPGGIRESGDMGTVPETAYH
jgi:hypothetical protein